MRQVVVVLGPDAGRLRSDVRCLQDERVRTVINPDPARGMFSSLQAGLATATGDPLVVLPGDMPFVRGETVAALLDVYARERAIVSPRRAGKRGHPVILPPDLAAEILSAEATSNLHVVLRRHPDRRSDVDVDDPGVLRDVDTVEDLRR